LPSALSACHAPTARPGSAARTSVGSLSSMMRGAAWG